MPLVGFTCPSWVPTRGERNTLDHCLGQCPHPCAAPPLLAAIYEANQRNYHKGAYLSASMLAADNCMRQTQFERMEPYYETVNRLYWPFRGTIVHGLLEAQDEAVRKYGWLQELRMSVPLVFDDLAQPLFDENGDWTGEFDDSEPLVITINGTTDLYNPWKRQMLDAKTMACNAVGKFLRGDYKPQWEAQTNIYSWLVANSPIPPEFAEHCEKYGLPPLEGPNFPAPEYIGIQAISMMDIPQTGSSYKQLRGGQKDLPPLRVWSLDETEAFIRHKAIGWYRTLVLGIKAPIVSKESSWLCGTCTFNGELIPGERCHPRAERQDLE
jgi:hypothetical protein